MLYARTCTFIGGCADGAVEILNTPPGEPVTMGGRRKFEDTSKGINARPFIQPRIMDHYRSERFQCGGDIIEFYVLESMPLLEAVKRLFAYYEPH